MNNVNHPDHYGGDTTYEAIKVIEAWGMGPGFCLGNAVKYICRAGRKVVARRLEDLHKAAWYLARHIANVSNGLASTRNKSAHQDRVEEFMIKAGQDVPSIPTTPTAEVRLLRAKLIMEECLETINALGIIVTNEDYSIQKHTLGFEAYGEPNMVEVVDGCADIMVVTTGTLSAFGIADVSCQELIDESNLAKFAPGGYRSDGSDGNPAGKWIKSPDWKAPNIQELIEAQTYEAEDQI